MGKIKACPICGGYCRMKGEPFSLNRIQLIELVKKLTNIIIDEKLLEDERHDKVLESSDYSDYIYRGIYSYLDYSKGHLSNFWKSGVVPSEGTIIDVGAGLGVTTLALKRMYPHCKVVYNDFVPSVQFHFAANLFSEYNLPFNHIDDVFKVASDGSPLSLVVMLEFNEHLRNCIEITDSIIYNGNPEIMLIANSFTADHPDHCKEFEVGGKTVSRTKMGRVYNENLRSKGYELHPSSKTFWNGRPSIWMKKGLI